MGSFIEFLEGSALAIWVRESPSIFAYTTVLSLHAMGLAIVVGVSAAIVLRSLGFALGVPLRQMLKLYPLMWIGFTINALSGFALLVANLANLLASVMFLLKIAFIVVAVIGMELLRGRLVVALQETPLGDTSLPASTRGVAIGALVLWAAALITGRLTAYPNFVSSLFS